MDLIYHDFSKTYHERKNKYKGASAIVDEFIITFEAEELLSITCFLTTHLEDKYT